MKKPSILLLLVLPLAAALVACSKKEMPPANDNIAAISTDTKFGPLMRAVFGNDYREEKGAALASLPNNDGPDNNSESAQFVVEAKTSTVLATGETALVTSGVPVDEEGNPSVDHASPGQLSVYVLMQTNNEWKIIGRYDNIDALGSAGNVGTAKWVQLGAGKTGLAMLHGGTWMGYSIQLLSLYSVAANKVERLTGEQAINMESDSNGACTPDIECWDIHGDWQFVDNKSGAPFFDLSIAFTGERSPAVDAGEETATSANEIETKREAKPVSGTAVYRYQDSEYKLLSGENIVPNL